MNENQTSSIERRIRIKTTRIGSPDMAYIIKTREPFGSFSVPKHCKLIGKRAFNRSGLSGFAYQAGAETKLTAEFDAFMSALQSQPGITNL